MVRILSDDDVASVLDLRELLPAVADAFEKQRRGEVERPDRPHYPIGTGLDPDRPDESLGTGLCMPAYVHGAEHAATKLVAVHEDNPERGVPTVNAQIALTGAADGRPVAYLAGNRITNARTGCIGGLAARELALDGPIDLAVIGAGTQARWQSRAIAAATDVDRIRVYSPSDSKVECADDLEAELGVPAEPSASAAAAVEGATVVVTATTSTEPVFPGDAIEPGTLVIAVGAYTPEMRELDAATIERAASVAADVPSEAAETGDLREFDDLDLVPFGDALAGGLERDASTDVLVMKSVGTAVLDAAAAAWVFDRAETAGIGETVPL